MSCQVTFFFRELHPDLVIVAADETGCYFDMPANKTLEKKGTKSVKVKTTGKEKER